jgi:hypothetical protein
MGCGCRNKSNKNSSGNERYLYYTPRQLRNRQGPPQIQQDPPEPAPVPPEEPDSNG